MKSLGPTSISSQGNTLKHLVLSKNKLSEVPTRALQHLSNLEHLNLNENQIQVLRNEAFTGLSKVRLISFLGPRFLASLALNRSLGSACTIIESTKLNNMHLMEYKGKIMLGYFKHYSPFFLEFFFSLFFLKSFIHYIWWIWGPFGDF